MNDPHRRWTEILNETSDDVTFDDYVDACMSEAPNARSSMGSTGVNGDPMTSRGASAYHDLDADEDTLGDEEDPIDEALASVFKHTRRLTEDDTRKAKLSSVRNIRNTLEQVWQMLGNAETKLGTAQFTADDMDFNQVEHALNVLVGNIKDVMGRLESARDQMQVKM